MSPFAARPQLKFIALLLVCLLPSVAAAQVPQFDSLYVFGDSLADNGNVLIQTSVMGMHPPVPPSATPHRTYFQGRFSNGYIGFEHLWQHLTHQAPGSSRGLKPFLSAPFILKAGALNFAFGGTGTPLIDKTPGGFSAPGLKGQVELFRLALLGKKPSNRALYAIATGSNDYRSDPFNVPMNPVEVVGNIENAIVSLYRLGARNILVLDLPDLGKLPVNLIDSELSEAATGVSAFHNLLLYDAIARLQAQYPQLHLITVKLDPLFNELRSTMDSTTPMIEVYSQAPVGVSGCLFVNPASCIDMPPIVFNANNLGFLFWDIVHPTSQAHQALGDEMYKQLKSEFGE